MTEIVFPTKLLAIGAELLVDEPLGILTLKPLIFSKKSRSRKLGAC